MFDVCVCIGGVFKWFMLSEKCRGFTPLRCVFDEFVRVCGFVPSFTQIFPNTPSITDKDSYHDGRVGLGLFFILDTLLDVHHLFTSWHSNTYGLEYFPVYLHCARGRTL